MGIQLLEDKDRKIKYYYTTYTDCNNDKQKILALIETVASTYMKEPKNSVIGVTDVSGLHFDMEILNAFKNATDKTAPWDKKIALVGVNGLLKVAYNFVIGVIKDKKSYRAFEKVEDALEWLAKG